MLPAGMRQTLGSVIFLFFISIDMVPEKMCSHRQLDRNERNFIIAVLFISWILSKLFVKNALWLLLKTRNWKPSDLWKHLLPSHQNVYFPGSIPKRLCQDIATPGQPHVPVLVLYRTIPETVYIAIWVEWVGIVQCTTYTAVFSGFINYTFFFTLNINSS